MNRKDDLDQIETDRYSLQSYEEIVLFILEYRLLEVRGFKLKCRYVLRLNRPNNYLKQRFSRVSTVRRIPHLASYILRM